MWVLFKRMDGVFVLVRESDFKSLASHPDLDRYVVALRNGSPDFEAVWLEPFYTLTEAVLALVKNSEREIVTV